jgi:serine/threonine-protein kinase
MHARRRAPQPGDAPAEVPAEFPTDLPAELENASMSALLPAPGALLHGRYRILSLLGRGGMGVVYKARDLSLGRDVAVKVLRAPGRASLRARFQRETQLASRVHHPHAVYVVDAGELPDGSGFLVMELLKGRTLRAVLSECGRMEPRRACRIGARIASAMQSVHEAGIVHRDLKPANVFLLAEGGTDFVKIVDFGVARELDLADSLDATAPSAATQDSGSAYDSGEATADSQPGGSDAPLTRHGALVGMLRYMAPEQIRSEAVDARADQYALGCILYEMLTGAPPFGGEAAQVARGHLYGAPAPPRQQAPEAQITPELEALVLRALSRQRERRFAGMKELGAALTEQAERRAPVRERASAIRSTWRPVCIGALTALTATAGLALTLSRQRGAALGRAGSAQGGTSAPLPVPRRADEVEDPVPPRDRPTALPEAAPVAPRPGTLKESDGPAAAPPRSGCPRRGCSAVRPRSGLRIRTLSQACWRARRPRCTSRIGSRRSGCCSRCARAAAAPRRPRAARSTRARSRCCSDGCTSPAGTGPRR